MRQIIEIFETLVEDLDDKRPFGVIAEMPILKCLLEKIGFEVVDCIHLAQDRIQ
jgi:hypothetical protein